MVSIFTVEDARGCLEESEADALMLGRGCVERPWLFNEIARELYKIDIGEAESDPGKIFFRFVRKVQESFVPEK